MGRGGSNGWCNAEWSDRADRVDELSRRSRGWMLFAARGPGVKLIMFKMLHGAVLGVAFQVVSLDIWSYSSPSLYLYHGS